MAVSVGQESESKISDCSSSCDKGCLQTMKMILQRNFQLLITHLLCKSPSVSRFVLLFKEVCTVKISSFE